jgi:hypothetical protein
MSNTLTALSLLFLGDVAQLLSGAALQLEA